MIKEPLPIQSTREVSPCKGCVAKVPACHDRCQKYKEWKKKLDVLNDARKKYDMSRYNRYPR